MATNLERAIGVLNGAIGDHLARTGNGLATTMAWARGGVPARGATPRAVVLVHGVMGTEDDWNAPGGGDYGAFLARDLGLTPLYVRYNSGGSIAGNGAALATLLEALVHEYPTPLEEIVLLGYSMGGLVVRTACGVAQARGDRWLGKVRRAIYCGTPHRGAPAERAGRVAAHLLRAIPDPCARLIADLGDLRSDGIKDLGDAHPVSLLPTIEHHLIVGMVSADRWLTALFGDGIVPCPSASDGLSPPRRDGPLPSDRVAFFPGVGHVALARDPDVYARIRGWCGAPSRAAPAATADPASPGAGAIAHSPLGTGTSDTPLSPRARGSAPLGLVALVRDAVEHGSRAVERIQKETAARPFAVLARIPSVGPGARVVHAVHDVSVSGVHGAIRLVNRAVGAAVAAALAGR